MGDSVDSIPVISQVKSAAQAIGGDTKGARETQERFSKTAPIVSQVRSAVEAASGDTESARRTQEAFGEAMKSMPVVSQGISAAQAISGDTEGAKDTQQQFLDRNIKTIQQLVSGSFLDSFERLSTSTSLTARPRWMSQYSGNALHELLIPGTHDTATYKFRDVAAPVTAFAKAQGMSVYDQLQGGIRFLDIRYQKDGGTLYTAHGFPAIKLQEVLDDVKRFVDANPGEVVIFWLQKDSGEDASVEIKKAATATWGSDRFVRKENINKPMNQYGAREQIVYIPDSDSGLTRNNSWDSTKSPNPIEAVMKCIDWARQQDRKPGEINLLACEATMFAGESGAVKSILRELSSLGQGLEYLAGYSNYATLHALLPDQNVVNRSNIINIDFANDRVIGAVIGKNKPKRSAEPRGEVVGIGTDQKLYLRGSLNDGWVKAPDKGGAVTGVAIYHDGRILGIGTDNKLYTRATWKDGWVKAPDKGGAVTGVAIYPDGKILGIGTDKKLYTRATLIDGWVKAPDKGGLVTGVAIYPDGMILGIGTDKKLYTRASLNDGWVKAPDKGGAVIGVAIYPDGWILGIGTDKKLYTRESLNDGWVKAPDKGGQVTGVAIGEVREE